MILWHDRCVLMRVIAPGGAGFVGKHLLTQRLKP
jgi:hypothetical protein